MPVGGIEYMKQESAAITHLTKRFLYWPWFSGEPFLFILTPCHIALEK